MESDYRLAARQSLRGLGTAAPTALGSPEVGQWYIQVDNLTTPTFMKFFERIGPEGSATWVERTEFRLPLALTLAGLKGLMEADSNAAAHRVWGWMHQATMPLGGCSC